MSQWTLSNSKARSPPSRNGTKDSKNFVRSLIRSLLFSAMASRPRCSSLTRVPKRYDCSSNSLDFADPFALGPTLRPSNDMSMTTCFNILGCCPDIRVCPITCTITCCVKIHISIPYYREFTTRIDYNVLECLPRVGKPPWVEQMKLLQSQNPFFSDGLSTILDPP